MLIRPEPAATAESEAAGPPRRGWLRPLVWGTATTGLVVGLSVLWLEDFAFRSAFLRRDYAGINRVLDRMGWFGRDSSAARLLAARNSGATGDWDTAFDALKGALAMHPDDPELHSHLVSVARRLPDPIDAARRLRDALRLAPAALGLRNELAWMLATSDDPRIRQPEEAVGLAESLVRDGAKSDANSLDTLAAAYAAAGRFDDAIRVASQAETLAQERGENEMGEQIRQRLALYREHRPYLAPASADGA